MQLGQEPHEVLQAAAEPINRPRHHYVELALGGIAAHGIEARSLVSALGAADAVVLVDLHDVEAGSSGNLPQLTLLVGRRLVDCRDPQVENGALHGKNSPQCGLNLTWTV